MIERINASVVPIPDALVAYRKEKNYRTLLTLKVIDAVMFTVFKALGMHPEDGRFPQLDDIVYTMNDDVFDVDYSKNHDNKLIVTINLQELYKHVEENLMPPNHKVNKELLHSLCVPDRKVEVLSVAMRVFKDAGYSIEHQDDTFIINI